MTGIIRKHCPLHPLASICTTPIVLGGEALRMQSVFSLHQNRQRDIPVRSSRTLQTALFTLEVMDVRPLVRTHLALHLQHPRIAPAGRWNLSTY